VSLQVAILKVLSSYPDGRATVTEMKADLAILAGAGHDRSERLKRLADRAPSLDIFTQGFVIRDTAGWQLTDAGQMMLRRLEDPVQGIASPILTIAAAPAKAVDARPPVVLKLVGLHDRSRRRCRPIALKRSA
jgi:hypothetical protein